MVESRWVDMTKHSVTVYIAGEGGGEEAMRKTGRRLVMGGKRKNGDSRALVLQKIMSIEK